eukprot:TRINITY_DN2700_c0_g1_i1.p1 TRINITY_DN2700_c0_g1~~TRINITY_DN2700_c0_g1_i1.p1  ORF type:complete len:464 (+),score=74.29 TRINITY_DN2700_c0_g1_i1:67-1458(+)
MSKELVAKKRSHMAQRPLLIILLEGVLGDVCKQGFFDHDPRIPLFIRPGLLMGLKLLISSFQVVVISYLPRERLALAVKYFVENEICFDGFYDRFDLLLKPLARDRMVVLQDFSKVYLDFNIRPDDVSKRVLVISSISLDHDEIDSRDGLSLVYENGSGKPFFATAAPLPFSGGEVPISILVPNPRAMLQFEAVPMEIIVRTVRELAKTGAAGWARGFVHVQRPELKKVETTVYQKPDPRTNYSLDEQDQFLCRSAIHRFVVIAGSKVGKLATYERTNVVDAASEQILAAAAMSTCTTVVSVPSVTTFTGFTTVIDTSAAGPATAAISTSVSDTTVTPSAVFSAPLPLSIDAAPPAISSAPAAIPAPPPAPTFHPRSSHYGRSTGSDDGLPEYRGKLLDVIFDEPATVAVVQQEVVVEDTSAAPVVQSATTGVGSVAAAAAPVSDGRSGFKQVLRRLESASAT